MKNTILILLTCLMAGSGMAQTTQKLTADRNAYRASDQIEKQQVEFKDPGGSGRSLNWDFSMLQPVNEHYSLSYFAPDPEHAEKLCGQEHNTRYYYRQQGDSLWATGFENSTTYMQFIVPELRMRLPFAYGDTLYSYFTGKGEYSHRVPLAVKGYTLIIADAEGDLMLPGFDTVKKALRVRTLRHYTETGKDSLEMTLDTYSWYALGIRYPVFESVKTTLSRKGDQKDPNGESINDTTVFSTSFFYPPGLQISQVQTDSIPVSDQQQPAVSGAAAVFTEAHLMPNPVVDNLYINYKLVRNARIWFTVHNYAGIPLRQTSPQQMPEGVQSTTINMRGLIPGAYSLVVHVDDMVMRLIVIKQY